MAASPSRRSSKRKSGSGGRSDGKQQDRTTPSGADAVSPIRPDYDPSEAPSDHTPLDPLVERFVPGLLLICMFLLCLFPMLDHDLWWHLRTGRLIWEEKAIPQVDRYLFTDFERPWVDLHWGFQLMVWGLYCLGGTTLIQLVKAAVLTVAVAVGWRASGQGLPTWQRVLVWIPAIICITGRAYERPEVLSQLGLVIWLWAALHIEERPGLKWLLWGLPLMQVAWINCHALSVLGLVVGACYGVDRLLREFFGGRFGLAPAPDTPTLRGVLWCGVLCGVAALCNPYFEEGALFPLELYKKFSVDEHFWRVEAGIGEFQRPFDILWRPTESGSEFVWKGLVNSSFVAQTALALITIASFVVLGLQKRWSPFRLLVFMGFAHLGWKATRNVNIFAFAMAVVALANYAEAALLRRQSQPVVVRRPVKDWRDRLVASPNVIAGVLLIAWGLAVVCGPWSYVADGNRKFGLGEQPWWFGHEACQFAGREGLPKRAILGHVGLAGVYEFYHATDHRVFTDPRLEVITKETFKNYIAITTMMAVGNRAWEPALRDSEGNLPVLVFDSRWSRQHINGLMMTPGWRMVYADPAAAVFVELKVAEKLGLPAASPAPLRNPP